MNSDLEVSAFRRVMHLSDWIFAFACPTRRSEFRRARAAGEFCHSFSSWVEYQHLLLSEFESCIAPFERRQGLRVLRMPSARRYGKSLTNSMGVVLYAHCDSERRRIEFREGMVGYSDILHYVPIDFRGIADMSTCDPRGLRDMFKAHAPRSVFKSTAAQLDAVGWLRFYRHLFGEFAKGGCSYAQAISVASVRFGSEMK